MVLKKISQKQRQILKFPFSTDYDNIICDGAVRSGKTVCMIIGYILWAMAKYNNANFGICGKTVASAERNIITELPNLKDLTKYFNFRYSSSKHRLTVSGYGKKNNFYVFGGKDESSYMLIQGITLSGVFFDEVALMAQSFVNQAVARTLSVKNSKLWFNCNPEHPEHWFHKEWIDDADTDNERNSLHLHFLLTDNPIMDDEMIEKALRQFPEGTFRDRYIFGKWVIAEGLVYQNFDNISAWTEWKNEQGYYCCDEDGKKHYGEYYISIDYGTANPCSMGLWFVSGGIAVRLKEYYYNSREKGRQKTDSEYYDELTRLAGDRKINSVVIDPSAASFITLINQKGRFSVRRGNNDVIDGIRFTNNLLMSQVLQINKNCFDSIREFGVYRWDDKKSEDAVVKENDHAMDDIRYFTYTVLRHLPPFSGYDKVELKIADEVKIINGSWV